MALRHVWYTYNVVATNITKHEWTEPNVITNELTMIPFAYPNAEGVGVIQVTNDFESNTYIEANAEIYYGIAEGTGSEPTVETHPYVMEKDETSTTYYRIDAFEITPAETEEVTDPETQETTTVEKTPAKFELLYSTWNTFTETQLSCGTNQLEQLSNSDENAYPHDEYITNGSEDVDNWVWYKYQGYDDYDVVEMTYNLDGISEEGSVVIIEATRTGNVLYPYDTLLTWEYTLDNGASWVVYASEVITTKILLEVDATTTGFAARVTVSDGFGYVGEPVTGSMIYVLENTPPTVPKLSCPAQIMTGKIYRINWSASTDAEGTVNGYELERKVNGGVWQLFYVGDNTYINDTQYAGTSSVEYRVRAVDDEGLYSDYDYSGELEVTTNTPPAISGKNENLGIVSELNVTYSITDSNGDVITAVEYLDDVVRRSYTVTTGMEYSISITGTDWENLDSGTHVIKVVATDAHGDSTTRSWIFKKITGTEDQSDVTHYRAYRKNEDGSYSPLRFENDSGNVLRAEYGVTVEDSLHSYLPETQPTDDLPGGMTPGKIIIGKSLIFVGAADGSTLTIKQQSGGHIVQPTAPDNKELLWVDNSDSSNPLMRFWNATTEKWEYMKSIYSGGTMDT